MGALEAMAREVGRSALGHLVGEVITRVGSWFTGLLDAGRDLIDRALGRSAARRAAHQAQPEQAVGTRTIKERMALLLRQLREQALEVALSTARVALTAVDAGLVTRHAIAWVLARVPALRFVSVMVPLRT